MAERFVLWVPSAANNIPVTETVLAIISASTDQDVSVSNLPSAPIAGARTVRIRVSLTITSAPGANVTVRVRQGQGITGTIVPTGSSGISAPAAGTTFQYEVFDLAPPTPITYSITVTGGTSAGSCFAVCEIEEVN